MNKQKKALCIASMASNLDNFNRNNVNILRNIGYKVTLASNFCTDEDTNSVEKINAFMKEMDAEGISIVQIDFSRKLSNIKAQIKSYQQVKKLLSGNYDLIHCHSPICAAITRFIARKSRKKGSKIIYTAHGFHFYNGAPLKNWLIFYPIEWLCSWWTDVLITINKEDYKRASEHFHAKKTVYIPGVGVDTEKFKPRENGRDRIRKELGLKDSGIMLLSVGELNENKNHEAVIRALAKFSDFTDTDNVLNNLIYVIVGRGELKEHLASLAESLGVKLILTGYRNDVADFYDAADVYVLPSHREGLNVSLMEAMASGLPIACSKIRGNMDLIDNISNISNISNINNINDVDKEESWQKVCQKSSRCLFDPTDIADIRRAISYAIKNQRLLGEQNLRKIKGFDLSSVQNVINTVYSKATSVTAVTAATEDTPESYSAGDVAFTDSVTPPQDSEIKYHNISQYPEYPQYRHLAELFAFQQKRKEIGVPLNAKLLISVGELSKRKNHKVVVEALQELVQEELAQERVAEGRLAEEYWYVIVGRGPLHDDLLAADHTGRLKLLGYRTDIVEILRCSDLFVFPSLQEGLPVALMEAMSCGIPCIASRIRGNVDLLDEDNTVTDNNWGEKIQTACRNRILSREYRKENIENKMKMIYKG